MQSLEVSGAVRPIDGLLGVKRLTLRLYHDFSGAKQLLLSLSLYMYFFSILIKHQFTFRKSALSQYPFIYLFKCLCICSLFSDAANTVSSIGSFQQSSDL